MKLTALWGLSFRKNLTRLLSLTFTITLSGLILFTIIKTTKFLEERRLNFNQKKKFTPESGLKILCMTLSSDCEKIAKGILTEKCESGMEVRRQ